MLKLSPSILAVVFFSPTNLEMSLHFIDTYVLWWPILTSPVRFAFPTRPEQVLSKHKVSRGSHGKTSANLRISGIAFLKTWLIHCKISFLSSPREPG